MKAILYNGRLLSIADQILFSGFQFFLSIALCRIMGLEQFGVYAGFLIMAYLGLSITNGMLIQPMQIMLHRSVNQKEYIQMLIMSLLGLSIITILIITVIASLDYHFLNKETLHAFSLFLSAFLIQDFGRKLYLCKDKPHSTLLADFVFVITTTLVLFLVWKLAVLEVCTVFGTLAFSYIISGFMLLKSHLKINVKNIWAKCKVELNYHIQEGKWLLFTACTQWISNHLFVLASGAFLGPTALGALRIAQSAFGVLNLFLQTIENYIIPRISNMYQQSVLSATQYLNNFSIQLISASVLVLAILFTLDKACMFLLGGEEAVPFAFVIKGYTVLYLLITIAYPTRIKMRVLEKNAQIFYGYVLSGLASSLLFYFLINAYALYGAILGLIINQLILFFYWNYSLSNNKLSWKSYTSF